MDTVIGLLGLAIFIATMIAFAAGVTLLVIRATPAKKKEDTA